MPSELQTAAQNLLSHNAASERGTLGPGSALYLVATPIGNLEDITLRALRVLKEVDVIACEDTRQTQKLLNHYGIHTRTVSYHEHNEMTKAAELVVDLESGAKIALVTDAGMPGISDPGFHLITLAIRHRVPVVPIPGASAYLAALVASGLPTDSFRFSGFLPSKSGQRRKLLESIRDSQRTEVFYEAPHRLLESLQNIAEVLSPERHIVVAREVTKLHEEFLRGRVGEILSELNKRDEIKGEITLLIAKAESQEPKAESRLTIYDRVKQIMSEEKVDEKDALKKVAKERGIGKSEAYREFQRTK
ncbi:MAG TPA: 16S rRNA (cytidine(1402)-2'-O)-methyltransferase [Terriglobales bacterium]|nr:16S rRNA (cytidine(1402)-2'-O)-methyltransferase [Terriglobales bacterium]